MKRILVILGFLLLSMPLVLAIAQVDSCDLDVSLLNQDPYPAVPGEVVDLVFQVNGLGGPDCGFVSVVFIEKFPFTLDPKSEILATIESGTYIKDFENYWLIPYKVRVDEDVLDGDNNLELNIKSSSLSATSIEEFQINVHDLRTDFEVSVKEYDSKTKILTFQILNIGKNDVEALTIDIPHQDFLEIKGSSRNIIGSLDSNDDTTFSFEAIPKDGDLKLIVIYTDEINERRTLEKIITFDSSLFNGRAGEDEGRSIWFYITLIIVVILIYRWYRNRKNKRRHAR